MDKKEKLKKMPDVERAMIKGFEELAKQQCAYITILLKKLNATEGNAVHISDEEMKQALDNLVVRAFSGNGGMNLYYVNGGEKA